MERKEKKSHKIHLKDYTNRLEKVLEKKNFSLQTKNLLLSMFYKIENAYADYEKTKIEVYDKGDFLEDLIGIIEEDCKEIEIIKLELEGQQSYTIDKEKGKIILVGNEQVALTAILEIEQNLICIPEEEKILEKSITHFLNLGSKMHETEVIRDFNGWSWDAVIKEIEDIPVNLAYQNFLYLLGHEFMSEWIQNDSKLADYLMLAHEKLKNDFGEERAKKVIYLLCKLAIENLAKEDKEEQALWEKLKKENSRQLIKLNNKKDYLEEITKKKKEITKKIDTIDKMLNSEELLQKEYETRNEKLPNKEKIFSIRQLGNKLEIERQEYVDEMKQYNELIDPKGYVARKDEIEKRVEFLNILDFNKKADKRQTILNLCLLFLSCFQIKIAKSTSKQEIIDYFYILRYYRFLPFDEEGIKLKDIEKLQEIFEHTIELWLEKAYKLDAIDIVTDDYDVNYKIIRNLFDSKMIDLNHTVIETKIENGKLYAQYYDTNILETTCEIPSNKTVKLKKKTKLFV
ncbi:MAG: hypothetical protein HFJ28_04260 [Clostridia bacterium]|nr:hypothetical protein [Clostridia bacterium]